MPTDGGGIDKDWILWTFGVLATAITASFGAILKAWQGLSRRISDHEGGDFKMHGEMHGRINAVQREVAEVRDRTGRSETTLHDHERRVERVESIADEVRPLKATLDALGGTLIKRLDAIDRKLET